MPPILFICRPISILVSGLSIILSTQVQAETASENLETMVVTATGYEQTMIEAPASISVIDRAQIESRSYKDLADALSDLPGVIITSGGSRQDISLRGMPSEYTLILVDGRKQSGRETQVSSSGGYEQDWLPSIKAIERIEVVRGPMSTLYGSDAIGGVINVITRKDHEQWHGSLRGETIIQEDSDSGNFYQGELHTAGPLIDGLLSASFTSMYQERIEDDILYANGGKTLSNYRGSIYLTPTTNNSYTFDYTYHEQERVNTEGKSRSKTSETNNQRNSFGLAHSGNYSWGDTSSYISQETVDNIGGELEVVNSNLNSQWSLPFDENYLTFGRRL
ncbi:TonB-dependent receptor plug domain-containing protein [Psychromonas sp. KJ10-10]|uniref:TonB-dependent receptor plug domain-containing protein n=1 Tax=Psychromonas sp. KJ10-10 TaxID=3391823 RepID=UPI0039B68A16